MQVDQPVPPAETDAAQAHAQKVVKLAVQRALANPDAAAAKPATTKPAAAKPATTKPAATKSATTKPATTKPAAVKPATTKWPKDTLQFGRPGQAAYIQQIPCDDPTVQLTSTNIMSTKVWKKGYSLFARRVKTEFENVIACTVEVEEIEPEQTSLPFAL